MIKKALIGLGLLLIFLAGMWVMSYYNYLNNIKPEEQSQILLEQIDKVAKLVTVEGHFIEYYDYNEPETPLFIGPMFNYEALLPKKAAKLRVRAKVLVGYDMEKISMQADNARKVITISNLPTPEIIAIDHEIDQFDNEASIFRPLNSQDYVKIDKGAQEQIRKAAYDSKLISSARQQGEDLLELIGFIVRNAGWSVELSKAPVLAPVDTLAQ
ncbi:MAG: DUF4230 domain-containing protein [Bacteroidota bacterium]